MSTSNKRSRDKEVNEPSKKRQTTLLSMFKPIATIKKPVTANMEVESLKVPTKDPRDLFKGASEETLELLDLELRTMNYEWLKVLAPELVKPYFLKVILCVILCVYLNSRVVETVPESSSRS